ncbi:SRPBCC family protein [Gryllotalpicola ginsengisoli]|uniref:SRPBCC family protein n=1 Tax=Gryllotalpicola ginsengisoli TaxID=444608 RepID=UPI0003B36593|nr:SRPBCC domain-containing protein [Gryllotalpicola ginsengisoli]
MPEVIRTIEIAAPPSVVWKWFSTQDALRRWWGTPDLEIDLVVGGAFTLTGPDGETRDSGTVLELDPERRLVLSWLEEGTGWVHPGRLLFLLEPTDGGTRVTLQHDGFAGIGKANWQGVQAAYERGADAHALLPKLAELVADAA